MKVEVEHKLNEEQREEFETRIQDVAAFVEEGLEALEKNWKRTVYIGIACGAAGGFTFGYVVGKVT